jgi:hypothetical protein
LIILRSFTLFNKSDFKKALKLLTLLLLLSVLGCGGQAGTSKQTSKKGQKADVNDLGPTIGSLVEIFATEAIPVKGYALVGGLNGTGSSECPPQIRTYLEKYILQHVSGTKVNINDLIKSPDTAVTSVDGIIPPAASKNEKFDIRVSALNGTQTTSLEGGWLYGADLYEARQFGMSSTPLAISEGSVYVDLISSESADLRTGYVLGGGSVREDYAINLTLRKPDYRVASQIRNRINERFEFDTAWALTPAAVEIRVPNKYQKNKVKFIYLLRATYLGENPELTQRRIEAQIRNIETTPNKYAGEIAIEAIGKASLPALAVMLNSSNPEMRFRAARCMLDLGDTKGREVIFGIATDKASPYRIDAITTIINSDFKEEAIPILRGLLNDSDFKVRQAVYESMVRLNDSSISRKTIANTFYLDEITSTGKPLIYVSRQNHACVALFNAPIYCRNNLFVQTPDGSITINAPENQQIVTIIRKHPRHPDVLLHMNCSLDLADIIQTLCKEPVSQPNEGSPGLGVPYSTLVWLLKQMSESGTIGAEFQAGPLPKTLPNIK